MIKPQNTDSEFELGGINHVALVCADMAKTVDFYQGGSRTRAFGWDPYSTTTRARHRSPPRCTRVCTSGRSTFQDSDGITLEFACWTKEFDAADVATVPRTDAERRPPGR